MVLVVGAIEVTLTLPARGEHELHADAIGAVLIQVGLVREEMAIQGAFGVLLVVEAVEADGALLKVRLLGLAQARPVGLGGIGLAWVANRVFAAHGGSRNHAKVCREGRDVVSVEEIVSVGRSVSDHQRRLAWYQSTTYASIPPTWLAISNLPVLES